MTKVQKDITAVFVYMTNSYTNLKLINSAKKMVEENYNNQQNQQVEYGCLNCCDRGFSFEFNEFYMPDSQITEELYLKVLSCSKCEAGLNLANDLEYKDK